MKQRVNHVWHDDWILKNLLRYKNYTEATEAYNQEFNIGISMPALKNHCRYKLGMEKPKANYRHITESQSAWLKEVYPRVGVTETVRLWNEKYGDNASRSCIKQIARRVCDITVDPDIATANKLKSAHGKGSKRATRETGDTRMECGRLVMKAEDGTWKSAGRCVWEKAYGKIPEGYALLALDGDTTNINLSNLEIVPWKYLGKLQRNNFFSSDPDITKAGIIWCDLETVLSQNSKGAKENDYE